MIMERFRRKNMTENQSNKNIMPFELEIYGRSSCATCHSSIPENTVRVFQRENGKFISRKWCYHLSCYEPQNPLTPVFDAAGYWGESYIKLGTAAKAPVQAWMEDWNKKVKEKVEYLKTKYLLWQKIRFCFSGEVEIPLDSIVLQQAEESHNITIPYSKRDCPPLPKEVLFSICYLSTGPSIVKLMSTNKMWYGWISENEDVWKRKCIQWFYQSNSYRISTGELSFSTEIENHWRKFKKKKIESTKPLSFTWRHYFQQLYTWGCSRCGEIGQFFPLIGAYLCADCRRKIDVVPGYYAISGYHLDEKDLQNIISIYEKGTYFYLTDDLLWYTKHKNKIGEKIQDILYDKEIFFKTPYLIPPQIDDIEIKEPKKPRKRKIVVVDIDSIRKESHSSTNVEEKKPTISANNKKTTKKRKIRDEDEYDDTLHQPAQRKSKTTSRKSKRKNMIDSDSIELKTQKSTTRKTTKNSNNKNTRNRSSRSKKRRNMDDWDSDDSLETKTPKSAPSKKPKNKSNFVEIRDTDDSLEAKTPKSAPSKTTTKPRSSSAPKKQNKEDWDSDDSLHTKTPKADTSKRTTKPRSESVSKKKQNKDDWDSDDSFDAKVPKSAPSNKTTTTKTKRKNTKVDSDDSFEAKTPKSAPNKTIKPRSSAPKKKRNKEDWDTDDSLEPKTKKSTTSKTTTKTKFNNTNDSDDSLKPKTKKSTSKTTTKNKNTHDNEDDPINPRTQKSSSSQKKRNMENWDTDDSMDPGSKTPKSTSNKTTTTTTKTPNIDNSESDYSTRMNYSPYSIRKSSEPPEPPEKEFNPESFLNNQRSIHSRKSNNIKTLNSKHILLNSESDSEEIPLSKKKKKKVKDGKYKDSIETSSEE